MKLENNNANLNGNKQYEYGIETAAAHPRFISTSSDIAWIKLEKDVIFVPNQIQPICLPVSDDGSDVADLQPVGYRYITYSRHRLYKFWSSTSFFRVKRGRSVVS